MRFANAAASSATSFYQSASAYQYTITGSQLIGSTPILLVVAYSVIANNLPLSYNISYAELTQLDTSGHGSNVTLDSGDSPTSLTPWWTFTCPANGSQVSRIYAGDRGIQMPPYKSIYASTTGSGVLTYNFIVTVGSQMSNT